MWLTDLSAVQIKAELTRAVYTSGTEKPPPPSSSEVVSKQATGLFNLGRTLFKGWATPSPSPTPLPKELPPVEVPDPNAIHETSVSLSVYSIDIAVTLNKKLSVELQRATKKEAPARMKYELIYVSSISV